MNYHLDEQTAEYNRQRIHDEFEQIRLERFYKKLRVYRPGRFERTMFEFANWMISTGKKLRKRYEIPSRNSEQTPSRSLVR
jgi:hypothetical protein